MEARVGLLRFWDRNRLHVRWRPKVSLPSPTLRTECFLRQSLMDSTVVLISQRQSSGWRRMHCVSSSIQVGCASSTLHSSPNVLRLPRFPRSRF